MAPSRKYVLTKEQRHMYASETLINFRWISKIMATRAPYTLSSKDFAPAEVKDYVSEIGIGNMWFRMYLIPSTPGQFAEITYSTLPTQFIFDNLPALMEPTFPLEGYHSVRDAQLVSTFTGKTAHLPGYLAYRPQTKQLVLAFAGTTTLTQAFYDVRGLQHRHPSRRGNVHSGFWKLYKGIKSFALETIRKGLAEHDVAEFVITGHSMGAAVSQLLLLDILRDENLVSIGAIPLKLVVFGAPRSGNEDLVKYWCELLDNRRTKHGEASIAEYSVKAYNDGICIIFSYTLFRNSTSPVVCKVYPPCLPLAFGYRHYAQSPFYFVHGRLYQIPLASREYALFHLTPDLEDEKIVPDHPRGGHNYYNGRDMEKFARRMMWLEKAMRREGDWKERYRAKVAKHSLNVGSP
ncbi:Triacylglycerol lipase [Mycena venus]|uniref:Triacylglycerol lipase n=1 Tax=Mycena venus TaxID=2733690 RepID=A0A8H7D605_9AGAR|nr:Triacylglycerol lipase [Mycena venus]